MARTRTKSNRRVTGGTLDAEAIKQANKRKRADGKKRCYACLKGSTTRCLQVCSGASDFCLVHSGWLSKIFAGDLGYSRFIDSDDELELSESENEEPKPQKKKQKPRKEKKKKKKKKKDIEEYEVEEEKEVFPSQALPARLSTDSNEVEPLGLLDDVLNFVPTLTKGAKPTPGLVSLAKIYPGSLYLGGQGQHPSQPRGSHPQDIALNNLSTSHSRLVLRVRPRQLGLSLSVAGQGFAYQKDLSNDAARRDPGDPQTHQPRPR